MQFVSGLSCNFKMTRGNQVLFSVRFVAAISQGFRTCLKLDATLARQKLHGVAATKIARVNWPLGSTKVVPRNVRLCKLQPSILIGKIIMQFVWICDKKLYSALALFFSYLIRLDLDMISKTSFLEQIIQLNDSWIGLSCDL